MPSPNKELIANVLSTTSAQVAALGMHKRKDSIYTMELVPGVLGWLGLNRATGRSDGRLEINPVVGARHQEVEDLIAEALGEKAHPYIPATMSIPLGYLMPDRRYTAWFFADGDIIDASVHKMVAAIQTYGFPVIRTHTSIDAISNAMHSGLFIPSRATYQLPVVHFLQGKADVAAKYIDAQIAKFGEHETLASRHYKVFAAGMSKILARK